MIPLARDSVEFFLWRYKATEEEDGDVVGDYTLCKKPIRMTLYQQSTSREQLIEGQNIQAFVSIHIANNGSLKMDVRDRIGTRTDMLYELVDLKQDVLSIKAVGVVL